MACDDRESVIGRRGAVRRAGCRRSGLRKATADVSYTTLVRQAIAQRPPLKASRQRLSDWFLGRAVPDDPAVVCFLGGYLQPRANRTSGYQQRPLLWRLDLRQKAVQQRQAKSRRRRSRVKRSRRRPYRDRVLGGPSEGILGGRCRIRGEFVRRRDEWPTRAAEAFRESVMTARYTFDVYSTSAASRSYDNADWGPYWGEQGPEFSGPAARLVRRGEADGFGANTFRQMVEMMGSNKVRSEALDPELARVRSTPTTVLSSTLE